MLIYCHAIIIIPLTLSHPTPSRSHWLLRGTGLLVPVLPALPLCPHELWRESAPRVAPPTGEGGLPGFLAITAIISLCRTPS